MKKNGSKHFFRRKDRRANQVLEKVPGHPTKKSQHNFAKCSLSRRQSKPLTSTKNTLTCPEQWCVWKNMTSPYFPLRLINDSRTTDHIPSRLRRSRLKIQEHLSPTIKNTRFTPNKQRERERVKAVFSDCRNHVFLDCVGLVK